MDPQEMASGHSVPPQSVLIVRLPADRHAVFNDQNRAIAEIFTVILTKKPHPIRQYAPIPPFARHAVHQPAAQGFVLEFVIPPDRNAEHMSCERIVIIQPDIVESRLPLSGVEFLHQWSKTFRQEGLVTQPIADLLRIRPKEIRYILF